MKDRKYFYKTLKREINYKKSKIMNYKKQKAKTKWMNEWISATKERRTSKKSLNTKKRRQWNKKKIIMKLFERHKPKTDRKASKQTNKQIKAEKYKQHLMKTWKISNFKK